MDDRPANLLVYELVLAELNEELVMVHSGEEALEQVESEDFAVILLDVNMPGLGGFETARRIRANRCAHLPIIFMTAFADDFRVAEGDAHGAVDYIQTPVVPEVLRAKVKVFADLYHMSEELHRRRNAEAARECRTRPADPGLVFGRGRDHRRAGVRHRLEPAGRRQLSDGAGRTPSEKISPIWSSPNATGPASPRAETLFDDRGRPSPESAAGAGGHPQGRNGNPC